MLGLFNLLLHIFIKTETRNLTSLDFNNKSKTLGILLINFSNVLIKDFYLIFTRILFIYLSLIVRTLIIIIISKCLVSSAKFKFQSIT